MTDKLYRQVDGTEWSWKNLNTVWTWGEGGREGTDSSTAQRRGGREGGEG